ncbi:hypothetical protein ID866_6663 [Astraeus odoratus]|nr:hypothetical protein ID866_6663 [Astraeus odoratus]
MHLLAPLCPRISQRGDSWRPSQHQHMPCIP